MTKYDSDWAVAEEARRKWMAENSLYSEDTEHFHLTAAISKI